MTLSEVAAARVHLVLPKESLYQSNEDQTKASVILKLKNGRTLAESSVNGIINVVASSVKGLSPDKIAVIDYRGKVLSRNEGDGSLTGQQLDARQNLENELTAKITQILEPAVGAGKVRPQVSVSLNFRQVEETVEQYDPGASVIRSQQRQEERAPADTVLEQSGGVIKANETTNYEVTKAVRHIVNPVGTVERVSVAVLIDDVSKTTTSAEGRLQTTSEPRSAEEMKKYRDLVAAAIAFNPDRGDQL
jgi:flagellar M-ring protein FliF